MGQIINKENLWQILRGTIVSLLIGIAMLAGITLCVQKEYISLEKYPYILPIVWFISSMVGACTAGERTDAKQKTLPLLVSGFLMLILLTSGILVFDGVKVTSALICLIGCMSGGTVGLFVRTRSKKYAYKRKRKHAYR